VSAAHGCVARQKQTIVREENIIPQGFFYLNRKHTDKKENKIFLIYKEIQSGALAKSYIRKGFLIYAQRIYGNAQIFPHI
jgi:hypothetical protein